MIRPQMKRSKEAKAFRESLAVGDKIITSGGIHGKVLEISDTTVLISTESGKLRLEKASVTMNEQDQLVNQKKQFIIIPSYYKAILFGMAFFCLKEGFIISIERFDLKLNV